MLDMMLFIRISESNLWRILQELSINAIGMAPLKKEAVPCCTQLQHWVELSKVYLGVYL